MALLWEMHAPPFTCSLPSSNLLFSITSGLATLPGERTLSYLKRNLLQSARPKLPVLRDPFIAGPPKLKLT